MKRVFTGILALLCMLSCFGCVQSVAVNETQKPTEPIETPEPKVGMQKVFGKDIVVGCVAPKGSLFAQGAAAQSERIGIPLEQLSSIEEGALCDALLVYDENNSYTKSAVPSVVYRANAESAEPQDEIYFILYDKKEETKAALSAMYDYPSHEAPIRILGLFAQEASEGAQLYTQMETEGKLQSKGCYYESDGYAAETWLQESLSAITVGVLDTVYAETPKLALQGFSALQKAARNDAVEICAAGLSKEQLEAMQEDHFLMGSAVGANEYDAGKLALRMALCALSGENVEKTTLLKPFCLYSDDVFALKRENVTEMAEVLDRLDTTNEELYNMPFMKELAEYDCR